LIRFGPLALEIATTALLGGIALFGSHTSTRDQIMAKVRTHEARRAAVIGGIELQSVGEN
jgi:hypothetical protein